ncbi:MAG: LptF/LptG family permease [Prevotellaceae bacterium]|nr:LptF/LptG family permease [Prevotellaceae bacterium]
MKVNGKLKILDRYIIRKFIGTYFFALLLIICIIVVFDMSEKIEKFINNVPLSAIIFDYYLRLIPYYASLFSPLFVFITVIFFTSKMASSTEIVAILSSGVSFKRLLYPYFISAFILATFSLVLNLFIIPPSTKIRQNFENTYIRRAYVNNDNNIHFQLNKNEYVYMSSFNTFGRVAQKFSLEKLDNGELKSKLMSDYAQYDTVKGSWHVHEYFIRIISETGQDSIIKGYDLDTVINLNYADLASRDNVVEAMDFFELRNYYQQQVLRGAGNTSIILIEQHQRVAMPFSTFILTLIGVSLSSRKVRGGIGLHVGLGIGLGFTYILFMQFCKMFVQGGLTSAGIAIWIPNMLFAIVAFILYKIAPK